MSKCLYISDVHHRWRTMKQIIDYRSQEVDKIIFGGDAWDNFKDTPDDARQTAEYLLDCLHRPNFIWIAGNHCLPYIYPTVSYLRCSGNTAEKSKIIREVMGEYIYKYRLYYFDDYFLYSHAGLNPTFLPPSGFSPEWLETRASRARISAESGMIDTLLCAGFSRGGSQTVGGIIWQDWDDDFVPISGVNQVCAHTCGDIPRRIYGENSINHCIDTHSQHYAIITDGKVTLYNTNDHSIYE